MRVGTAKRVANRGESSDAADASRLLRRLVDRLAGRSSLMSNDGSAVGATAPWSDAIGNLAGLVKNEYARRDIDIRG